MERENVVPMQGGEDHGPVQVAVTPQTGPASVVGESGSLQASPAVLSGSARTGSLSTGLLGGSLGGRGGAMRVPQTVEQLAAAVSDIQRRLSQTVEGATSSALRGSVMRATRSFMTSASGSRGTFGLSPLNSVNSGEATTVPLGQPGAGVSPGVTSVRTMEVPNALALVAVGLQS